MSEIIVITSGKGGVGKTTTTANLSTALAGLGKRVVAIDADIGLRNLDIIMGLENRIVYNLVDITQKRCDYKQALIRDKRNSNLYLLPSSQVEDKTAVTPEEMQELCADLSKSFDYIVIDCPAGIEQGFRNAVAAANQAIVVTTPEVSAVRDADRIIGLLQNKNIPTNLLVNRLNLKLVSAGDMMSQYDVMEILAVNLLGVVIEDTEIVVSGNQGVPVVLNTHSNAGQAYLRISRRLMGEKIPIPNFEEKRGFFSKIFGLR